MILEYFKIAFENLRRHRDVVRLTRLAIDEPQVAQLRARVTQLGARITV